MKLEVELNKPYTEEERLDFIVKNNHKSGYFIEENIEGLKAYSFTEAEITEQEQARIALLSLTAADVERAIYKAKGMDFEDILKMVKENPDIDSKALRIEFKANNFYRGNPYIEQIGTLLGFTSVQLDEFFQTGDYTSLMEDSNVGMVQE